MESSNNIVTARMPGIFLFTLALVGFSSALVAEVVTESEALSHLSAAPNHELPSHAMPGRGVRVKIQSQALGSDRLVFLLPDGARRVASRSRTITHGRLTSWVGEFEDRPGSLVVMSHRDGETTGFLHDGQRIYEIRPAASGDTLLYEVDTKSLPPPGSPLSPPLDITEDVTQDATQTPALSPALQESNEVISLNALVVPTAAAATGGGVVQDIMLLYTQAVKNFYGNASITESVLRDAVIVTNQAYIDSDIDIELKVVYMDEIDFAATGDLSETLTQLRAQSDGVIDDVHTWRDVYGADLVALISVEEDPESCGLAFRPYGGFPFDEFDSFMFSVIEPRCLSSGTLAHEVGHNQGICHDREDPASCGEPETGEPKTPPFFPYSWGYCGTNIGTLMASTSSCRLSRIRQFSNPQIMFGGEPTGIDFAIDPLNSADATRSINNTAAALAGFRFPDADLDGMSNEWETVNGFDPSDPSDATGDVDMDGLSNVGEFEAGSDPRNPDTDGDAFLDNVDAFPLDPAESLDTDRDGIGNNADTDDDNDGIPHSEDDFPLDPGNAAPSAGGSAVGIPSLFMLFVALYFRQRFRPRV